MTATRREFTGKDNYGKPKSEYVAKLKAMDDEALFKETKDKIWLAGYAKNNPRSDYHWHVDAIYDEWTARNKVSEYAKAYEEVLKSVGG